MQHPILQLDLAQAPGVIDPLMKGVMAVVETSDTIVMLGHFVEGVEDVDAVEAGGVVEVRVFSTFWGNALREGLLTCTLSLAITLQDSGLLCHCSCVHPPESCPIFIEHLTKFIELYSCRLVISSTAAFESIL